MPWNIESLVLVGRFKDPGSPPLSLETGEDNSLFQSVTGLYVKLCTRFSFSLIDTMCHNSDIVDARGKRSDDLATVDLVYAF